MSERLAPDQLAPDQPNGELPRFQQPPTASDPLTLNHGVTARLEGNVIKLSAKDGTELFFFQANNCPFDRNALQFLMDIYAIGYDKGRIIGRELAKIQIRDMLGKEL